MTQATDFGQWSCKVGSTEVQYYHLVKAYVCTADGRTPAMHRVNDSWEYWCPKCHGQDFITRAQYERQQRDADEVFDGLPPELRQLLIDKENCDATR